MPDSQDKIKKRPIIRQSSQAFAEHGKIPPQAIELEEAVLGALMLEQNALTSVIDILHADIFYRESHKKIFEAIHRLFGKNEPVDILTVTNELKQSGELELIGGPYYITQLTNRVASSANIEFHSRILIQKFIQRRLIEISSEIIKEAFEETTDVFDLLDDAEKKLFSVSETHLRRSVGDMSSLVREALDEIESIRKSELNLRGIPSGFIELDRVTAGWQKSDLIILASRPGMGKTAFILSMARNITVKYNKPIAVFSLEMSALQLVTRLISSETQLAAEKLRKGSLEQYEWEQLNSKISPLLNAPLYIDDTPGLSIFELRAKCRRLKHQYDISMVIIDYLQLMTTGSKSGKENREQEISNISRSLKSLAKELDVPVVALSQLSRAVETRAGSKRPILSDLRESGAIEQDADLVLFIYRPEYYKITEDEAGNSTLGMAELIIAKHRNGALKDIPLRFIDKFARFEDMEQDFYGMPDIGEDHSDNSGAIRTIQSRMDELPEEDIPF